MFIFVHIGRGAGTSFRTVLRKNFGDKLLAIHSPQIKEHFGVDRATPSTKNLTDKELTQILNCYNDIECISGHFFNFPNRFDNFKPMTILRDPVTRVVSHFFSFRRKYLHLSVDEFPDHMKYDYRNDMNLFFKHWDHVQSEYGVHNHCKNYQTYVIDNNLDIDKAIDRIRNNFWFVGLVERFDEGLLLLRDQFKELGRSLDIKYVRQHVAANMAGGIYRESVQKAVRRQRKEKKVLVTDEIREKIKEMNQLDYVLYKEAKKLFNERLNRYQGNMKADLSNYRRQRQQWKLKNRLYCPFKNK